METAGDARLRTISFPCDHEVLLLHEPCCLPFQRNSARGKVVLSVGGHVRTFSSSNRAIQLEKRQLKMKYGRIIFKEKIIKNLEKLPGIPFSFFSVIATKEAGAKMT